MFRSGCKLGKSWLVTRKCKNANSTIVTIISSFSLCIPTHHTGHTRPAVSAFTHLPQSEWPMWQHECPFSHLSSSIEIPCNSKSTVSPVQTTKNGIFLPLIFLSREMVFLEIPLLAIVMITIKCHLLLIICLSAHRPPYKLNKLLIQFNTNFWGGRAVLLRSRSKNFSRTYDYSKYDF